MYLPAIKFAALAVLLFPIVAQGDEAVLLRSPETVITVDDIDRYIIENIPSSEPQRTAVLSKPTIYQEMAESLLVIRTLAKEAESSLSIDKTQARWSAAMAYQRKLVQKYREEYVQGVFENVNWDATAKDAYNAEPGLYVSTATVSASHILLRLKGRTEDEALALAGKLRERVLQGEDFAELAKAYSEDTSAQGNGGYLGHFGRGKMAPAFERAAFALKKPGDISEPVKTSFGYHIIKLQSQRPAGAIPFEEAKSEIIAQLQVQMSDQLWQDKIIAIRSNPELKLNEDFLAALKKKYSAPAIDR